MLQFLSRTALLCAVLSFLIIVAVPSRTLFGACFGLAAAFVLWIAREVGHRRSERLRSQVLALGGSLDEVDAKVESNHPKNHTAAAITAQGELATWQYSTLIDRMKQDGYI